VRRLTAVRHSRLAWLASALLLAFGLGGVCLLAAASSAAHAAERATRADDAASVDIMSRLRLALQREGDLVVSAKGFRLASQEISPAEFDHWTTYSEAFSRHPEVTSLYFVSYVRDTELAAFARQQRVQHLAVFPDGDRPFYCLVSGLHRTEQAPVPLPRGMDRCEVQVPAGLLASRDSGRPSYGPVLAGTGMQLALQTPMYAGTALHTAGQRRAAFMGWVIMTVDPKNMLHAALAGHPGFEVRLRYRDDRTSIPFHAGHAAGADHRFGSGGSGWTIETVTRTVHGSVFDDDASTGIALGGAGIAVLFGLLVFVLGTGRARARRLVERRTEQLRHQALHDPLTRLPNRALLVDRLEHALARARRNGSALAAMMLDLDGFKKINDTYGHGVGDQLLCGVAQRLSGVLRDSDTVGRLGGDEFVIIVEDGSPGIDSEMIAERIRAVLAEPFELGPPSDLTVTTRASIGIAQGLRATGDELLRDADVALYEAKGAGRDRYVMFAPEMQSMLQNRLELEVDLRAALARDDELYLRYQPTFDLEALAITGVEALLRWQHPTRGALMPDEFLPLAQETGQMRELGRWVLDRATRRAAAWERAGRAVSISVNLSRTELEDPELPGTVTAALARSGLSPHRLVLEIAEALLMRDPQANATRLAALKALGVRIAIDDFGTGYSTLTQLQLLPVDALKIDRSFVSGIANNPESGALVHTLVQLGKTIGLETYAEGVEDTDQLRRLVREQCDRGQGYLFARPLALGDLEPLLAADHPIGSLGVLAGDAPVGG